MVQHAGMAMRLCELTRRVFGLALLVFIIRWAELLPIPPVCEIEFRKGNL